MKKWYIALAFVLFVFDLIAQENPKIKFGKITKTDFEITSPLIDSNVNAIVIADKGESVFQGNSNGWFSLVFKRFKRIKILNNNGFSAADIAIYLYSEGNETEKLEKLEAQTYNLENGNITTTKLDPRNVFEEKERKNLIKKKFTFPAVKAGSIIELSYTLKSDFLFNIQPWEFQGEYPCMWSEYRVEIPEFFNYMLFSQGTLNYDIKQKESSRNNYRVRRSGGIQTDDIVDISTIVYNFKWGIKNVPALKAESFTSSINNYVAKINFQLSEYRFPERSVEQIMKTWPKVEETLLQSEEFGRAYLKNNGWLDDELKSIVKGANSDYEKARRIYEYVRDHFTCTNNYGIFLGDLTSVKDVFKRKSGTVGEINLLLLAMLQHESIASAPVILSSRSRGFVHPVYPLMDRFNYLICEADLDGKNIYLDASEPYLGFNKLPVSCYNGKAWVIKEGATHSINFTTDSLTETKLTTVVLMNDSGKSAGRISSQLGSQESYKLREKLSKSNVDSYSKEIARSFNSECKIDNLKIDSLKSYESPIKMSMDLAFKNEGDVIYFSPILNPTTTKNPFTSADRKYPIEMPYTIDETYILNMEIPVGYIVDELPKSVKYRLNEDVGLFEYIIVKNNGRIQLRSSINIKRANFGTEYYNNLRDFYAFVIKKQSEQIVLKKIN